jgi:hypothetical protein
MMDGEADVIAGWQTKIESTIANLTPSSMLAERTLNFNCPACRAI